MIIIKTKEEVELMSISTKLVSQTLAIVHGLLYASGGFNPSNQPKSIGFYFSIMDSFLVPLFLMPILQLILWER